MITIDVLGTPAPKGSSRAFINKKTGRAFVAPGGAKSTEIKISNWNSAVREAAQRIVGAREAPVFVETAIAVQIVFRMARPSSHYGKGKNAGKLMPSAPLYPIVKPDGDKLLRTTLDALKGSVYDDDSRIAKWDIDKVYAAPGHEGANIQVRAIDTTPGCFEEHHRQRVSRRLSEDELRAIDEGEGLPIVDRDIKPDNGAIYRLARTEAG